MILRAKDLNKDQSYFLWTLTQEQLKHCVFPIGEHTKPEVRDMARKFGLPTAEKKDSQGICFIGEIDMREFLQRYIPIERGEVKTTSGALIGAHEGLPFYTIGQRHGIGISGEGIPYYVTSKDERTNTLVVGEGPYDEGLFTNEIMVEDVNWIRGVPSKLPFHCEARIRYRQPLQRARIMKYASRSMNKIGSFVIRFNELQRAVTPGQSIVFYQNDEMWGGGIITNEQREKR
ncbi:MAG: tRNA-specific 2-thiouridylase [Parcubacteria group bacterium Gr01-1014_66]|nr:MAG: tRNA-specific 2-thiouridylase [Parcubacteria group bacterium Gr01-1014_66]